MTVEPLTREGALYLLEQAVQQRGADHVYTPSQPGLQPAYVHPGPSGTPVAACLIAVAFCQLTGVTPERMANWHGDIEDLYEDQEIRLVTHGLPLLTLEAWAALKEAQYAQDDGKTWGDALDIARTATPPAAPDLASYYLQKQAAADAA